jgi:hypothetical protein
MLNRKHLSSLLICLLQSICTAAVAQTRDTVNAGGATVTLSEVVVRSGMDVNGFIERVRKDTTFYKAFRNLRVLSYSSLNDIRMMDRKGRPEAGYRSRTRQTAWSGCRVTRTMESSESGDFFKRDGTHKYYTARLYDALFHSFDTICGQHNLVGGHSPQTRGTSGMERHKEQLKMLFFNPGADIPGIPLMGDKTRIFDADHRRLYDFDIDIRERKGVSCYVFRISARKDLGILERSRIVIDDMETWFDYRSFEVLQRSYAMRYDAGVYRFDVRMHVELGHADRLLVPTLVRYDGSWKVALKSAEQGVFTATLFDYSYSN